MSFLMLVIVLSALFICSLGIGIVLYMIYDYIEEKRRP